MSNRQDATADLKLDARMDIIAAESLLAELQKTSPAQDTLVIDAEDVTLIDTPVIQILLSAARDQAEQGGCFTLTRPSAAVVDAMCLLGLENSLTEWSGSNE
ncbi:STAS domain-containing protein [Maricaulis sp.]|uniref:STAS domain-containing protein n=1 Tax=Maricaulis sp. TaxID=1486257 RepID=UPI0025BB61C0|nr:STAS domain-containing protein [Maricaulis sp.]